MLKSSINSEIRNNLGSNESNRIRNIGYIPGVVYGQNMEPKTIKLEKKEINSILRNYGTNVLVDLEVDGQIITSMIKEIQRDIINNKEIIHIDFQSVSFDKAINATVPITLIDRREVEDSYATIQHQLREINIECLPQNLPENIKISVKDLAFGRPLKIGDVEFGEEITVLNAPDEVIASLAKAGKIDDEEIEEQLITESDFDPIEEE
ncbi:50S ribosomal protein L25 [Paramaledivibacter caminithermalis]|jgi:large subunit ribosomal protein L25|uniref:Large ribosomal subunit protein bL25 n=1 Tax=Paramaledivibacter caminithermalis (strain DSM 15212 / CIP 107654 / DViRD3) TaxID=1121301 RepID=A0A1M6TT27_PARC5|nr:50S ribosomal protein L25 [Paramaledivibacter caminithermalis]SHK60101.1 large subunit ribosomal protein L25 [Paramaledivibacter caminithermalis DSM 15212]